MNIPNTIKERFFLSFLSTTFFFCGGAIYVIYRDTNLRMFSWFKQLGLSSFITYIRDNINVTFPNWVVYSLPDGLWMCSFILAMRVIWLRDYSRLSLYTTLILPIFIVFTELLQFFNIFPGTYDANDLTCYLLPIIIYLIYFHYGKKNQVIRFSTCNGCLSVFCWWFR